MYSGYIVLGVFLVGLALGVGVGACFLAREPVQREGFVAPEPVQKHRPIAGSNLGPGQRTYMGVPIVTAADLASRIERAAGETSHPKHRPISG